LLTINHEAKVRRSTKSLVLDKAKVTGYEKLMEAREKRVEKDAAQKAKGQVKRGQKRRSTALEAGDAESNAKARRVNGELLSEPTASTVAAVVGIESVPAPWRAPVARMYY
jgi:hypothetical protein